MLIYHICTVTTLQFENFYNTDKNRNIQCFDASLEKKLYDNSYSLLVMKTKNFQKFQFKKLI